MKLRPEVQRFAEVMEAKMRKHDADVGTGFTAWRACTPWYLYRRMCEELDELGGALGDKPMDAGAVAAECADVANFAMMIAGVVSQHAEAEAAMTTAAETGEPR